MRIPRRYAPLAFGALLSTVMVAVVSAFVIAINQGIHADFVARWLGSAATTWLVAFPTVTFVAPRVRRIVERITAPA